MKLGPEPSTKSPTKAPTKAPTNPTKAPTKAPTTNPTTAPSKCALALLLPPARGKICYSGARVQLPLGAHVVPSGACVQPCHCAPQHKAL